MDFYTLVGRIVRFVIAAVMVIMAVIYIQDSIFEVDVMDIAMKVEKFKSDLAQINFNIICSKTGFIVQIAA